MRVSAVLRLVMMGTRGGRAKGSCGASPSLGTTPAKTVILVVVHVLYKFTSSLS